MPSSQLSVVRANGGASARTISPTQPYPYLVQRGVLRIGPHAVTAITRRWAGNDAKRCRLCPVGCCTAYKGVCTVQVATEVPGPQAPLFSTLGMEWTGHETPWRLVGGGASSAEAQEGGA